MKYIDISKKVHKEVEKETGITDHKPYSTILLEDAKKNMYELLIISGNGEASKAIIYQPNTLEDFEVISVLYGYHSRKTVQLITEYVSIAVV